MTPAHIAHSAPPTTQALLDAVVAISSDLDLPLVLRRLVASAAELTNADYCALGVTGPDGHPTDLVTQGNAPGHRSGRLLTVPVRVRGTVFGNLHLSRNGAGGSSTADFTSDDVALVQGLADAAGFVIESARAFSLSEGRRRSLEASAELADALQPPVTVDDAVRRVAGFARGVSGAATAAVVSLAAPSGPVMVAHDGSPVEALEAALPAVARATDVGVDAAPAQVPTAAHVTLVIPLRAHLFDSAVLALSYPTGSQPTSLDDLELLASFADQAALALDRAQAIADREELAVVAERARIARDLHDVVIQRLFATGLNLQALGSAAGAADISDKLERVVDDIDVIVREIRSTIFALQSPRPVADR